MTYDIGVFTRRRIISPAESYFAVPPVITGGGSTPGAEATAFLARATLLGALDTTHSNAYIDLINGLVADGVWAQLDILQIYATDTASHALLNLPNSTYNSSLVGTPSFTADRGYTGSGSSGTYMDPHFEPFVAITVPTHFQQNAACIGAWCVTSVPSEAPIATGGAETNIFPYYASNTAYARVNDATPSGGFSDVTGLGIGFYLGVRTGNGAVTPDRTFYRNSVAYGPYVGAIPSGMTASGDYLFIGNVSSMQIAAAVVGGNLDSLQSQLYTRLRTYMTAVGVP